MNKLIYILYLCLIWTIYFVFVFVFQLAIEMRYVMLLLLFFVGCLLFQCQSNAINGNDINVMSGRKNEKKKRERDPKQKRTNRPTNEAISARMMR